MILTLLRKQGANILTSLNMLLGLVAIQFSIHDLYNLSCLFILIAAVTDRLDGLFACRFKTSSTLGKYLDSNSDLISFGVAPGLLIYLSVIKQFGIFGILVSFLFIMAGAFRLARYNSVEFEGYYVGLPITIAGAILALSVLIIPYIPPIIFLIITLALSYLMISKHSIKKV
jgi:CDP-diacylglycerol---serine O-phosphatidyltransferase